LQVFKWLAVVACAAEKSVNVYIVQKYTKQQ